MRVFRKTRSGFGVGPQLCWGGVFSKTPRENNGVRSQLVAAEYLRALAPPWGTQVQSDFWDGH